MGEELLRSKHKCYAKVALPLSCKCSGAPVALKLCLQLLILECRGFWSFQSWNTKCFVFFSKHPQQIKCTRISLEFATVQLICGILSRSLPRFIPPSWLPTKPCQPGKHIPTPLCAHTPALCLSVLLEFCPLLHMRH